MPDIIKLLPDSVANQIAAGEVIQRPASVFKELMENSIDAGAGELRINIKDAGRTLVQVVDDGCGMSPGDAALAFERHSTSKISRADDLFAIRTLGFRGEALASIAAVAEVGLKTRRHEDELGAEVLIRASLLQKQEPVACPAGSNFMVRNLFFNIPARRKFLKTNATEFRHILTEFYRTAIPRPDLRFSLIHNGSEIYKLAAEQQKERIVHLFGKHMNQVLIPVSAQTSIVGISGFIGKPDAAKKSTGEQFFFVNQRFMRHPYLHKAVMEAYRQVLPPDTLPAYFLFIEAETGAIDINIHPTKTEIKFEDERAIYQILHAAVREALGKHSMVPTLDFDVESAIDIPYLPRNSEVKMPRVDIDPDFNPFEQERRSGGGEPPYREKVAGWESFYAGLDRAVPSPPEEIHHTIRETGGLAPGTLFQFKKRYIFLAVKTGMMIVDQKRAHERILFEEYLARRNQAGQPGQTELYPVAIELNPADRELLNELIDDICSLGFEIRDDRGGKIEILALPAGSGSADPRELLESFLRAYRDKESDIKEETGERIAASLARASAVGYGRSLQPEEMQELLDRLFACAEPGMTPGGKPVLRILPTDDIDKLFN